LKAGLRIDVDTYRGTDLGVPRLLSILDDHGVRGTFFFTVGPDNMGRHLWRLLRPSFAWKMLRTRAAGLYGWDILLRGTIWPGPPIGRRLAGRIRAVAEAGHEVGLHAWDHHRWQAHVRTMTDEQIQTEIRLGFDELTRILGQPPTCSAAPGWVCPEKVLEIKESFPFQYNSDCRGGPLFRPVVGGRELPQAQVPVSLPTYDEIVGQGGITDATYQDHLLSFFSEERLNVLTVHAEVEGIACAPMFDSFLKEAASRNIRFAPLIELVQQAGALRTGSVAEQLLPGRQGPVACQVPAGARP
jgi:undecaprenyl phosphate-alpha-L-ara4FN deformylase